MLASGIRYKNIRDACGRQDSFHQGQTLSPVPIQQYLHVFQLQWPPAIYANYTVNTKQ